MMDKMSAKALADALGRLPVDDAARQALEQGAVRLAAAVREALSAPAPEGHAAVAHDTPWRRTGALQDSISHQLDGDIARVGSSDPAARPQELGTARLPPRPFLAPVATALGGAIAEAIGTAVAELFE